MQLNMQLNCVTPCFKNIVEMKGQVQKRVTKLR